MNYETERKIKEKSIKLSARIFGIMTACLSSAIAAFADVETDATSGVWASVATWITKNKNGLSIAAKALLDCVLSALLYAPVQAAKRHILSQGLAYRYWRGCCPARFR